MGARRVSSLAGATVEVEGAGVALPNGLDGGGTVVVVKYNKPPEHASSEQEVTLGTNCVSITLENALENLPESDPVKISLPLTSSRASYCGFWDVNREVWSDAGCWTHEVTEDTLVCQCTHLTLFGGFLQALKTLDCSNRPDKVFAMLADLSAEVWSPAHVLRRTWLPVLLLVAAGVICIGGVRIVVFLLCAG